MKREKVKTEARSGTNNAPLYRMAKHTISKLVCNPAMRLSTPGNREGIY